MANKKKAAPKKAVKKAAKKTAKKAPESAESRRFKAAVKVAQAALVEAGFPKVIIVGAMASGDSTSYEIYADKVNVKDMFRVARSLAAEALKSIHGEL